jgi:hypothetical protein
MNTKTIQEKFWSKVTLSGSNDCWLWIGDKDPDGYGRIRSGTTRIRAHRVSYELFIGAIDKNLVICHKCDNPSCVNPKHLWMGTTQENTSDMVSKERHAYGERNGQSKLTKKQVDEIKKIYGTGQYTLKEIGKIFGVTYAMVHLIVKNKNWKHD